MIRLAYTVATPETEDTTMLAMRGPLEASFATLAGMGYHGAELMVRDPARLDPAQIATAAASAGMTVPGVSTGQICKEDSLTLCDPDPARREAAVQRLMDAAEFAAAVGAPQVNIGTIRGRLGQGAPRSDGAGWVRDGLTRIIERAEQLRVGVALEPQNRFVINWLHTPTETLRYAAEFGPSQPSILFDAYHVLFEEPSLYASLIRCFPRISHVQVADTNRLAPGWGSFNFGELIRSLRALDYAGFVSVEISQLPTQEAAAKKSASVLLPLLGEVNA